MEYSDRLKTKVRMYFAANFLYSKGKSHPQVVSILSEVFPDHSLVQLIADQAMKDEWRDVFNTVQKLTSERKPYGEIIDEVGHKLDDAELIHFIVNSWYSVETLYMENYIESEGNILEGGKYLAVSVIGLAAVIYFHASIITILFWSFATFVALSVWLHGRYQKRLSSQLAKILQEDFGEFGKLI